MNDWITNRPPTEVEVKNSESCWVSSLAGEVSIDNGLNVRTFWKSNTSEPIAWMPLHKPEPYQTPKPMEIWRVYHDGLLFSEFGSLKSAQLCIDKHPDSKNMELVHLRQVLPNNPTPEAIEEVAAELDRICEESHSVSVRTRLRDLAAKLRGKQ